jgi:preprotein translocase subunit SecG
VVLIQRSEGGGLGLGGGQGMGSFMTGRGTANLLTRTTAILGTVFFLNSLVLALHFKGAAEAQNTAILNSTATPAAPAGTPAAPAVPLPTSLPSTPADALPAPAAPAAPAVPSVPSPGNAP